MEKYSSNSLYRSFYTARYKLNTQLVNKYLVNGEYFNFVLMNDDMARPTELHNNVNNQCPLDRWVLSGYIIKYDWTVSVTDYEGLMLIHGSIWRRPCINLYGYNVTIFIKWLHLTKFIVHIENT